MSNISQRDAFWNTVYQRALSDRDIVIVSADMGAPALDQIRRDIPAQFINTGIAEQNTITLATGLAMSGKKVFTYAIAPFITLRCLEQIRVNNAMMNIPITIVGVGAGFGYEDSGPTHHLIEDIAVMRSMPNITINSITDSVMSAAVAEKCCSSIANAQYVRLDREPLPAIYADNSSFSDGLALLRKPAPLTIVSTGGMTHIALKTADALAAEGITVGVIDLYSLPVNEKLLVESLAGVTQLVTLEEHFLPGGLGSAVCEVLADHGMLLPAKRLGLPLDRKYCYEYGGRDIIRGYYGLNSDAVLQAVRQLAK